MERQNYWSRRLTRRRALAGAAVGGLGVGALAIAGCGGDDDDDGGDGGGGGDQATSTPKPQDDKPKSFLWEGEDTLAKAVKGEIFQTYITSDTSSLDPLSATSYRANWEGDYFCPKLVEWKPGKLGPASGELQGYLAEKLPEQPDPTTLIFKLRQNALWEDKAPTNKRGIDAEDVVFSWNKFAAKGQTRKDIAWAPDNTGAPVEKAEAVDKYTVKFTLKFPMAALLGQLAYDRNLLLMPRESEGGYDPRNETRSGGPFILADYQRSVGFQYKKNPNFWDQDKIFVDGLSIPIISETAVVLAQFKAKKIWWISPAQEDVIGLHKDHPDAHVAQGQHTRSNWMFYFGLQPDSPFRDPRVRRAVSMLVDRDAWIDTFSNTGKFKAEGYPVEIRYSSHLAIGWDGYWIDPRDKDMGEGGANFAFNVAEAKKLLSAAGFNGPIETEIAWISTGQYGTVFPRQAETFKGMLESDGLFKLKQVNPDYQTEYLPKYYWNKGDFKGIAVGATTIYPADPDGHIFAYYHSQGARQKTAYQGKETIDAKSDKLLEDQRKELDRTKRVALIKEWQRHVATTMPILPFPGGSAGFGLAWPWVGNYNAYRWWDTESARNQEWRHIWFDKSKFTG